MNDDDDVADAVAVGLMILGRLAHIYIILINIIKCCSFKKHLWMKIV